MLFRLHLRGVVVACALGLLVGLFAVTYGEARRSLYRLEIPLASERATEVQLFWDQGDDYQERASARLGVDARSEPVVASFNLSPGPISALRIDPFNTAGRLVLGSAVIRDSGGTERARLDVRDLLPRHQISQIQLTGELAVITTVAGADDPAVEWRLPNAVNLGFGPREWWLLGGRYAALTALAGALLGGLAFGRRQPRTLFDRLSALVAQFPIPFLGLATVVIWLGTLASMPLAPHTYLDASWQQALVWARVHDLQFGRDLVFTAGPWSWLFSLFYLKELLTEKLVLEAAGKLLFAILLVQSTQSLPGPRRTVFLVAFALVGGLLLDVWLMLVLALVGLGTVLNRHAGRRALVVAVIVFAFLAQVKFTLTLLAIAILGLGSLAAWWRGQTRRTWALPTGFGLAFLGWWLAAGQNPIRIPRWFELSLEVSRGYTEAMSVDPSPGVFWVGAIVLLGLGGWLARLAFTAPASARADEWPVIALGAGVLFVAWKHGFTRADGHVLGFFFVAGLLSLALPAYLSGRSFRVRPEWWGVLALVGVWLADDTMLAKSPAILGGRSYASAQGIFRPGPFVRWWDDFAAGQARRAELPKVKSTVGDATIDFINTEQGWLHLNDLNYHPRPVIQSYSVHTPELISRNFGWLQREDRAARYLLLDYLTIDGRYAAQDDSMLIAELPRRYEPVLHERNLLLLERKADQPRPDNLPRTLLRQGVIGFGEQIVLPVLPPHALWLKLHPSLSKLGRLRAALYHPPELRLIVREINGQESHHRLVVEAAAEGFIIQPYLPDLAALEAFLQLEGPRRAQSVRVETMPDEAEFWRALNYELAELPQLPLAFGRGGSNYAVQGGIANQPITKMDLSTAPDIAELEGLPTLLAHSPGSISFAGAEHIRELTGRFGLRPGAYTGIGQTDGVTFRVVAHASDGTASTLWTRRLQPVEVPEDQGMQRFTITVPAGATVELLTEPGPNANWDWSYWAKLEFAP